MFEGKMAVRLSLAATVVVLALLVATPLRVHVFVALLMLYAIGFLVANRGRLVIQRVDIVVMVLLSLYAASHLPVFIMSGMSWRYLSPGLHMVAVIPIYLMLRMAMASSWLGHFRSGLELGALLGAVSGALLAAYQVYLQGAHQADGFMFHINFGYLVASLFFLLVALIPGSQRRGWLLLGAVCALLATILSTSRGALFAIPLVGLFLLVLHWRQLRSRGLALWLVGFVVLWGASYVVMPQVENRIDVTVEEVAKLTQGEYRNNSAGGRVQLWVGALEAFKQSPWVGLTYDEREAVNASIVETSILTPWTASISRGHAHSQYFETLATGGIVGMVALFFYLIFPGYYFLHGYLADRRNGFHFAGLVFSLAFAIFCLSEVALQHEMIGTYYAFMLVVLFVLARQQQQALALAAVGEPAGSREPGWAAAMAKETAK
ncbi:O-antigen ligase family protein [Billgrantia sp. Q4P2]|uniref:O-antigen ligase family protein n=1 Tax=Billgrantia sp. Q4P2 TaxID=3463857 RepID=UPI0040575E6A